MKRSRAIRSVPISVLSLLAFSVFLTPQADAMMNRQPVKHVYLTAQAVENWVVSAPDDSMAMPGEEGMEPVTFTAWTYNGSIPGPVIDVVAGTTIKVHLTNNLGKAVSVHPHGVIYDIANDGSPETGSAVAPGETHTYTWKTSEDTVGTWLYHDHSVEGIARGLFGMVVVRSATAPPAHKEFFLFMGEFMPEFISELEGRIPMGMEMLSGFNGKSAPSNPTLMAMQGETVRFHVASVGTESHTFHLHGHRWKDQDSGRTIDAKQVGPFEVTTFTVKAGQNGPGNWLYHCHDLMHLNEGMVGMFMVE